MGAAADGDAGLADRSCMDRKNAVPCSSNCDEIPLLPLPLLNAWKKGRDKESQLSKMYNPTSMLNPMNLDKDLALVKHVGPIQEDAQPLMARADTVNDTRFLAGGGHVVSAVPSEELALDIEEFNIPWNDLVLKEKIVAGSFGTVHRADWQGSVIAAVGFNRKRLDIPSDLNSQVATIIEACWANEPWKRPSFSTIMDMLRRQIRSPLPQPDHTGMQLVS